LAGGIGAWRLPILRVLTWNVLYGGAGREEPIGAVVRRLHADIAIFTEAPQRHRIRS
jgi:hypothetical protein